MRSNFTPSRSAARMAEQGVGSSEVAAPRQCPHCGGGGILRMGDQQFRTCMECLGQGQLSLTVQQDLLLPSFGLRVSAGRAG
jgi:DnaJ-class molecular chaperone